MPTVREAKKRFSHMKPTEHVAIAIWCEDDVLESARELHIDCTKQDARDILDHIDRAQNCSLGITWTTITEELYNMRDYEERV